MVIKFTLIFEVKMYQRMDLKVNLSQSFIFIYYLFMATDITCKNI